jgi:hypothetical protein
MNANPPKREAALGGAAHLTRKLLITTENKQNFYITQTQWEREATRLFGEFWRTGQSAHLAAFTRHVVAMRHRLTRGF